MQCPYSDARHPEREDLRYPDRKIFVEYPVQQLKHGLLERNEDPAIKPRQYETFSPIGKGCKWCSTRLALAGDSWGHDYPVGNTGINITLSERGQAGYGVSVTSA